VTEYINGLGWAKMHVCALKLPVGCYANYYFSGGIVLIGSLLALMFTENNLKSGCEISIK
jgi:hypothetical protein